MENRMDNQLKLSTTDQRVDRARAMDLMDATPNPRRQMESKYPLKMLQGDRLGWWSSREFDRRVRLGAFVMGAVNDERTKIMLDMGANALAISKSFARKLNLKN